MADTSKIDAVAIVGMSCRFAGCPDLRAFWDRVVSGVGAISDCPSPNARRYLDSTGFTCLPTVKGGFLRDLWQVSPNALDGLPANLINPEYALASDLAVAAMRDASSDGKAKARRNVGVVVGYSPNMDAATVNWCQHGLLVDQAVELVRQCFPAAPAADVEKLREKLDSSLPKYDFRSAYALLHHTMAAAIARRLGLTGTAFCVNDGAASGIAAIQAAADELLSNRADVMLAGAVQGPVTPQFLMPFSKMGVLSRSGSIHPFGRDADGTLFGEGGAFLVLKRAADAVRDGNRIYAVVKSTGSAGEADGRFDTAIGTAVERACAPHGIQFKSFATIEANGSGIPAEDREEFETFSSLADGADAVAVGSVKSLVGHCAAAASIAGAVKAAASIFMRTIPPATDAGKPAFHLADSPLYLNPSPRPWIHDDAGLPRRAGVLAHSFTGGVSFLVLEQFSAKR